MIQNTIQLKSCPRCHIGDVYTEDLDGIPDIVCVQCGFRLAVDTLASMKLTTMRGANTHKVGFLK